MASANYCAACNFTWFFSCPSSKQPHQMRTNLKNERFQWNAYVNLWKPTNGGSRLCFSFLSFLRLTLTPTHWPVRWRILWGSRSLSRPGWLHTCRRIGHWVVSNINYSNKNCIIGCFVTSGLFLSFGRNFHEFPFRVWIVTDWLDACDKIINLILIAFLISSFWSLWTREENHIHTKKNGSKPATLRICLIWCAQCEFNWTVASINYNLVIGACFTTKWNECVRTRSNYYI